MTTVQPPPPIIPKVNSSRGVQLLDIDPEELARQLAIFEANLYNRVKPVDCLDTAWSRSDPASGANIKAMILTSNRMAAWVAQAILTHMEAKKRAQVMKYFLQVADVSRTTGLVSLALTSKLISVPTALSPVQQLFHNVRHHGWSGLDPDQSIEADQGPAFRQIASAVAIVGQDAGYRPEVCGLSRAIETDQPALHSVSR